MEINEEPEGLSLILVPGARMSQGIQEKLARVAPALAIESVDDHIREATRDNSGNLISIKQLAYDSSVDYVVKIWATALNQALEALSKRKAPHHALMMFPVWYGARRHERYSPLNIIALQEGAKKAGFESGVCRVLYLFDDIYDMAWRHSHPGEYWDTATTVTAFVDMLNKDSQIHIGAAFREGTADRMKLQTLALAYRLRCLSSMLEWRRQDLLISRNISASLCPSGFLPLSVKQLTSVAASFLVDNFPSIYLSHPISEPRRVRRLTGDWPTIVDNINALPARFLEQKLLLIMPTGIDELRLDSSAEGFMPRLDRRWPLPAEEEDLLYSTSYNLDEKSLDSCDPDHLRALSPTEPIAMIANKYGLLTDYASEYELEYSEVRRTTSAQMLSFAKDVEEQIGERDNALVLNTDFIFIYRPLFGGRTRFSAGVYAELRYWRLLRLEERLGRGARTLERRCLLYHSESDIWNWLASPLGTGATVIQSVSARTIHEFLERLGSLVSLSDEQKASLIDDNFTVVAGPSIDPVKAGSCRSHADRVLAESASRILAGYLSGELEVLDPAVPYGTLAEPDQNVIILVCADSESVSDEELAAITHYFNRSHIEQTSPALQKITESIVEQCKSRFLPRWNLFASQR